MNSLGGEPSGCRRLLAVLRTSELLGGVSTAAPPRLMVPWGKICRASVFYAFVDRQRFPPPPAVRYLRDLPTSFMFRSCFLVGSARNRHRQSQLEKCSTDRSPVGADSTLHAAGAFERGRSIPANASDGVVVLVVAKVAVAVSRLKKGRFLLKTQPRRNFRARDEAAVAEATA